jgi:hypothetical protein
MNERIRELADRAKKKPLGNSWCYTNPAEFEQKFAELIVAECMKLNRDILCEDDPDYLDKVYKEHFGVEE